MKRIAVVGAESTGKSTLCEQLAAHYHTRWVPEYGREYTLQLVARVGAMEQIHWTEDDFRQIAKGQRALDDEAERDARGVLFYDTDVLAISIWQERYLGRRSPEIEAFAAARPIDLYLLTGHDAPFVADEIRDGEHMREWMTRRFRDVLTEKRLTCVEIDGSWDERFTQAVRAVEPLFTSPSGTCRTS